MRKLIALTLYTVAVAGAHRDSIVPPSQTELKHC
jgi:hypothetical protein